MFRPAVIRFPKARHDTAAAEQAPSVCVVLPSADDRAMVRTALAVAHGLGSQVRAFALHGRGEELPLPLRMALFGLDPRNEADRAIRHLVDTAARGQHTAIRTLTGDAEQMAAHAATVAAAGPRATLIVGAVHDGRRPEPAALAALCEAWTGRLVVLWDRAGGTFSEVLGVLPPNDAPGREPCEHLLRAVERCYPVFRHPRVRSSSDLEVAAKDCTEDVLAVIGLPTASDPGVLKPWAGRLGDLARGPVGVVVPRGPERPQLVSALIGT